MLLNAALPFLFIELPVMLLALLLIATVEWLVQRHKLRCKWVTILVANLISTLVGLPLATLLRAVTAGMLYKSGINCEECFSTIFYYDHGQGPYLWWVAVLFLLFFNYWVSVWIEYMVLRKRLLSLPKRTVWQQVMKMNLVSYLLLGLFYSWLAWSGHW